MPAKSGLNSRLVRNSYGLQLTQVYSGDIKQLVFANDDTQGAHLRTQQRHMGALDHKHQRVRKRRDERN